MPHPVRALIIALLLLMPSAAAAEAKSRYKPGTGLAFGSFDITESDIAVTHVVVHRIKPIKIYRSRGSERQTVTFDNGDFYSPNLSPGVYAIAGFISGQKYFALDMSREDVFRIEPGQLVYAGSFKLRLTKGGFLQRDKGSFERVDSLTTEAALLRLLMKDLAGSAWATAAKARLERLSLSPHTVFRGQLWSSDPACTGSSSRSALPSPSGSNCST